MSMFKVKRIREEFFMRARVESKNFSLLLRRRRRRLIRRQITRNKNCLRKICDVLSAYLFRTRLFFIDQKLVLEKEIVYDSLLLLSRNTTN